MWENYHSQVLIKGTVSRDFLTLVFFIKHLLLVPLDMPRKDYEFFRILEELFEFVIDSPVVNTPRSRPKLVNKRTFQCKILQGVETPLCLILWGVLTPWSIIHENIFWKPVLMLVQSTLRSRLHGYSSQGSRDSPLYSPPGSRDSPVYLPSGS